MNPIAELLYHPWVLALGWALVHFLWQGAVIAGVLFAALTFLRRSSANARYLAGCAALVLMAAAPVVTFAILNREPAPVSVELASDEVEARNSIAFTALEAAPVEPPSIQMPPSTPSPGIRERLQNALPWFVAGWVSCVGVLALRLALGYWRVRRIGNDAGEPLDEMWEQKLADLAKKLRVSRPVQLCKSALVDVPTVIGWVRPIILFPAGALAGIPPAQLEAILAHELAHIRRHDYLVNLLQNLLETVLFYHPAVWWASRQASLERELCCDDLTVNVCGDRLAYAKALAALEESRVNAPELALAADGGSLVRRIRRLLGGSSEPSRTGLWAAGTIVLVTLAVVVVVGRITILAASPDVPSIVNPDSVVEPPRLEFRLAAEEGDAGAADEFEDPNSPGEVAPMLRVLKPVLLDESAITSAELRESAAGQPLGIAVKLSQAGADTFGRITEENVSRRIVIVFDGKILSAPRIQEKITGRELVIAGKFSASEINSILEALNVSRSVSNPRDSESETSFALLYGRLDPKEAEKIISVLEELRIPTRLGSSGTAILVPQEMVHRARMELATKGLPKENGIGFEIFDKPAFGMSDFIRRVNYLRAIQGELERTIQQIDGVESARVMIVRPEDRLLVDPNKRPTASVFLKLQRPDAIDEHAVSRIRFLVANSVEGLKAQNVSIVDHAGNVLAEIALNPEPHDTVSAAEVSSRKESAAPAEFPRLEIRLVVKDAGAATVDENEYPRTAGRVVGFGRTFHVSNEVFLDESAVERAFVSKHPLNKHIQVKVALTKDGRRTFARFTERHVRRQIAILFDGKLLSAPQINERIDTPQIPISGSLRTLTEEQAEEIAREIDDAVRAYRASNTGSGERIRRNRPPEEARQSGDSQPEQAISALNVLPPADGAEAASEEAGILGSKASAGLKNAAPGDNGDSVQASEKNNPTVSESPPATTAELVQRARSLVELGRMDEAVTLLEEAVRREPNHQGAHYYLNYVRERNRASSERKNAAQEFPELGIGLGGLDQGAGAPNSSVLLPSSVGLLRTNFVHTSPQRQLILQKLNDITLEEFPRMKAWGKTEPMPLSEALKEFDEQIRALDPDKRGVNFIINSQVRRAESGTSSGRIDSSTSESNQAPIMEEPLDLRKDVVIALDPPLRNVRAKDVLEAITKLARSKRDNRPVPLKYSIEDYAVVFSHKSDEIPQLLTRTFRFNPAVLAENLRRVTFLKPNGTISGPPGGTNVPLSLLIHRFISALGLDFPRLRSVERDESPLGDPLAMIEESTKAGQKVIFFTSESGILFVRATLPELDLIEQALSIVNTAPQQIMFEARFAALTSADSKALGFDWFIGNSLTDSRNESDPQMNAPSATVTGILTSPQFRNVLRALEQRSGEDVLTAPKVITVNGREAKIGVTQLKTIVPSTNVETRSTEGGNPADGTTPLPLGPSADITPRVLADGKSIEMTINARVVEFVGYDDPGQFVPKARAGTGDGFRGPLTAYLPLPRFRVRNVSSTATVQDGQTLVLGGFETRILFKDATEGKEDKVRLLGDIPLLGRYFRTEEDLKTGKRLIMFVTPTLIDPAGNPIRAGESNP